MPIISANRLNQLLLTAILGSLVWIAFRPSVAPVEAAQFSAGARRVQYKVADIGESALTQSRLDELGNDGWVLVTCDPGAHFCIFKKD